MPVSSVLLAVQDFKSIDLERLSQCLFGPKSGNPTLFMIKSQSTERIIFTLLSLWTLKSSKEQRKISWRIEKSTNHQDSWLFRNVFSNFSKFRNISKVEHSTRKLNVSVWPEWDMPTRRLFQDQWSFSWTRIWALHCIVLWFAQRLSTASRDKCTSTF